MTKIIKIFLLFISTIVFVYVLVPGPEFPDPPPDSLQSKEPADTESPFRRAYFTNLSREEVMDWYFDQFKWGYRLNYRPEEAQTIIRDQTRSTFLEEIVHPFRESVFINGFEPTLEKDKINIEDKPWKQKIIVRYVPSSVAARVIVAVLTLAMVVILMREYAHVRKN